MDDEAYKHPQWKRLLDAMTTCIMEDPEKKLYTYEELEKLGGIDIRSAQGRHQFDKFNQECEKIFNLSWANVINVGYRMIAPSEHVTYGMKRVSRARRQLKRAKNTVGATQLDKLNDAQKTLTLAMQSFVSTLAEYVKKETRKMIKAGHAIENPKMIVGSILEECKVDAEQSKH